MAPIAQLVERLICNQRVGSSSLSGGTKIHQQKQSVVGLPRRTVRASQGCTSPLHADAGPAAMPAGIAHEKRPGTHVPRRLSVRAAKEHRRRLVPMVLRPSVSSRTCGWQGRVLVGHSHHEGYGLRRWPRGGSLQSSHILILTTSSDQYGARHLMQTRQPTCRMMRGGFASVSSTASLRTPPSHAHGSGSSKPVSKRPPLRRSVVGGTGPVWVSLPLSPWPAAACGCRGGAVAAGGAISPLRYATSHAGSPVTAPAPIAHTPPATFHRSPIERDSQWGSRSQARPTPSARDTSSRTPRRARMGTDAAHARPRSWQVVPAYSAPPP